MAEYPRAPSAFIAGGEPTCPGSAQNGSTSRRGGPCGDAGGVERVCEGEPSAKGPRRAPTAHPCVRLFAFRARSSQTSNRVATE